MLSRARRIAPLFGNLSWFGAGCAILLSLTDVQPANAVVVSVDAAQTSGSLKTFVTFSQGRQGTFDRFTAGEQSRLATIGTRLVRIDAMLQAVSLAEGTYNWTLLDGNVDNVIAAGAVPVINLKGMPLWLADTSYGPGLNTTWPYMDNPPKDHAKWQTLVQAVVAHLNTTKGYGIDYFIVWNEPNHPNSLYPTGLSGYQTLYKYSVQGVRAADPTAKVGGPTAAGFNSTWIQGLLNYANAQVPRLPVDFVNWHEYTATLPTSLPSRASTVQGWLNTAGYPSAEMILTEYNSETATDTGTTAAITRSAGMIGPMSWYMLNAGIDEAFFFRVKRSAPDVRGIFQDGGTPVFPQYNSFKMLSMMAGTRISASEAMDANGIGVGALASKEPDAVTVLTWNYQNTGTASFSTDLVVSNLPSEFSGKTIRLKRYLVDETHSNVTYDSAKAELEKVEDLVLPAASGVSRTFTLQPNAVSLIVLSPESGSSTADTTAPSAPSNLLNPSVSSSAVYLTWSAASDNVGVVGYKVYRQGAQVATTASTSYSDTGLPASTTYSYTVRAYDAAGNTSVASNSVSATTQATGGSGDTTAPTAPSDLRNPSVSSSAAYLMWSAASDNVGVVGYKVYREGVHVATTANTSYSDTGLAASTTYSYTVRAYDAADNISTPSNTRLVTTEAAGGSSTGDTTAPTAPSNLRIPSVSSSAAYLMWSAASDNVKVVGYKVYRQGVQVATTASTSYADNGLSASTTYSYTVRAYDAAGNTSVASNTVSTTTQAVDIAPAPPKGLRVF